MQCATGSGLVYFSRPYTVSHMRSVFLPALLLLVAGCASTAAPDRPTSITQAPPAPRAVVAEPARTVAVQAPATAAQPPTAEADDAARRTRIAAASRGSVRMQVGRATTLRDSASLGTAVVAPLAADASVEALSYDGRYWGVRTADGQHGYVQGSALGYTAADVALVTTGARPAAPAAAAPSSAVASSRAPARTAPSSGTGRRTAARSAVCADYRSQAAAQRAYAADPVGLSELDGNSNGTACEDHFRARPRATPRRAARPAASRTCYTGPRGGRYYISASGRRVYGC